MSELIARMQAAVDNTIASEDPGCIAAIPSELTELAKAIGMEARWEEDMVRPYLPPLGDSVTYSIGSNQRPERAGLDGSVPSVKMGIPNWTAVDPNRKHPWSKAANDNYPPVVAFTGQAGAGKSTATRYLVENHGYTLVKFAGPLKDMCRAVGLSDRHIEGDLKEEPCDMLCGKSPRDFMQLLGSEFGRDMIGKFFWVELWHNRASLVVNNGGRVVVDDCRFPNEAAAVRKLGGDVYMIAGRGGIPGEHESERGAGEADLVIANDGPVARLHGKVEEALKRYG